MRACFLIWFFLVLFPLTLAAQQRKLSTSSKKAAGLYEKANAYMRARNFPKAVQALQAATEKDTTFGEAYIKLAGLYKIMGDKQATLDSYRKGLRLLPYDPKLNNEYFAFAELSLASGRYSEARVYFEKFLEATPKESRMGRHALAQLQHIAFAEEAVRNPVPFKPEKMGPPLNRFGMQYLPALTADQRHLVFTGRAGKRGEQDENLYVSVRRADGWTEPTSISPNINTRQNEGAGSISGDGKTLVFASCDRPDSFGSCDLYISYRSGETWSRPVNLGGVVNSKGWDSQPSLSADGRTLYFASVRTGGQGKEDIWVTTLNQDNTWSEPLNLGDKINTRGNENSPFIHPSGSTLYLSSNGHLGLGAADIFKASLDAQGNWGEPQNLGYPLNTFENESSLFITTDNKTGYYSRRIDGAEGPASIELYQFEVPPQWKSKQESTFAQGNVYDALTRKPLGATVQLYNVATDQLEQQVYSDAQRGDYTVVLTEGKQYAMYVSADGYLLKSLSFDYTTRKDFNPLTLDVYLEPLRSGANIVLSNLFFPFNQYTLEERSKTELNKLVQFLSQNKNVRIQISGHTDDVGDAKFNLELSRKRAQSVVNYLTQQGIARERLAVAGYGETRPVKPNDTEENRQLNRRIEMKVL